MTNLYSITDLLDAYQCGLRKMEQMIAAGEVPAPIRIGRLRRWHPLVIERHLAQLAGIAIPDKDATLLPTETPLKNGTGRPRNKA
jgi:hypothetical protein